MMILQVRVCAVKFMTEILFHWSVTLHSLTFHRACRNYRLDARYHVLYLLIHIVLILHELDHLLFGLCQARLLNMRVTLESTFHLRHEDFSEMNQLRAENHFNKANNNNNNSNNEEFWHISDKTLDT